MKPHSPETSVSPEFEGSVDSSEMSDTQFIVDRAATIDEVEISVDSDTVDKKVGADVEEKWLTRNNLALDLGVSWDPVKRLSELCRDDHPEWFETKKNDGGMLVEHLHPDLVELIRGELSGYDAPEEKDYISIRDAAGELDLSEPALRGILRKKYAEQVRVYRTARGKMARHISNDLLAQIKQERGQHELVPEGWDTSKGASKTLGISQKFVERFIDDYRETHPHWFRTFKSQKSGQLNINLSPELIKLIKEERGRYDRAPEEWMTSTGVAQDLGDEGLRRLVGNIANTFRGDRPEWFETYRDKVGTPRLHYHPELISEILRLLEEKRLDFDLSQHQKFEKEGLQNKIQEFLIEVEGGKTLEAQEFQKLIQLFGSERAVDILFQYRPDYKKIDVPFVRRIIGEYLGDFLSLKPDLNLEDLEEGVEYLAEPSLKEGLTEVVKNDALRFYNERHRAHPEQADLDIFALYVDNLRTQTAGYSTTELAEVVDEVARYYNSLFEISKPNNLVDQLKDGRLFPDVNQRINIKEIKMKHKMLIADEMGVGKSASAILAKETLGVKQALIVVPSNVVEVWQKYLSNQSAANGEAEGYFKVGQAPRVLTIESLKQLSAVNPDDYDYIILSQERLTSHYVEALEAFNYGMLIVDEVHKLKNIGQGKRAENLIELAARIDQGDDAKYLALLSGTPVPNKVGDVAMVLRLLYPEKFDHISNQELMYQILKGDMLDLRGLLVPRMQMKSLAESIKMPHLKEETHIVDMSADEKAVYEILLEEDELTASQKIQILRQFLLNPAISEVTPGVESTKLNEVGAQLRQTYMDKDKVVMFVNGYVEGVIRGGQTIFDQLELPENVDVFVIDGYVSKQRRLEAQRLLREPGRKMLLAVSGQTADVGVDFSGAQDIFFYNEPWTSYDKKQQQGRVWRPGLKDDLTSRTFYVRGSIEEGIHRYTEVKERAIEKLLRGVPLSELEQEMLRVDEQESSPDLDVNPALAEHYFSAWDRLLKIFNYVKEIGETNFVEFKNRYGQEYARCYIEMGSRSYQSNVNRLAGGVIDRLAKEQEQEAKYVRILDVASGPEMLKKHIPDEYQEGVVSVDINSHHFEEVDDKRRVGSFLDLPVADATIDYANLALALHYTKFLPTRHNYERIEVFKELNRVLVKGGVAVVSMMHTLELKHPDVFEKAIEKMGFKTIENYTGTAEAGQGFRTRIVALQKVNDCPQDTVSLVRTLGGGLLMGFKFAKNSIKLRDSRKIATKFSISGKNPIEARLNSTDQQVFDEEQTILVLAKELKKRYRDVQHVPREQIEEHGFARAYTGRNYVLFKQLETSTGAVIAK